MEIPKKYWQIAKRLSTAQLQREKSDTGFFDETDLFRVNLGKRSTSYFLGYYSEEGLKLALGKYGITKELEERGFKNLVFRVDTSDPYVHRLTIYDSSPDPKNMLVEVLLKKERKKLELPFEHKMNGYAFNVLAIEWMCMQNPRMPFSKERPRLPGQNHPGLGMASKAVIILMLIAWRLRLAGLVNTPDHYHNAYLYSQIFYYLNPDMQARLVALNRDTKKYELVKVAWALEWGALIDEKTGKPEVWRAAPQVVPLDRKLKDFFNSSAYRKYVKEKSKEYKFRLDQEIFETMREKKETPNED